MRVTGLEPAHYQALEPKSNVSANFTTPAYLIFTAKFILPTATVHADFIFQCSNTAKILRVCQFHHTRILIFLLFNMLAETELIVMLN